MNGEWYDRNIRFFGKEGQDRLAGATVAVVGVGGLGTHVVQQLSLLGVGHLVLIDREELDLTNLNRYVGVRHDDPIPGTLKVEIGQRLVKSVNPQIQVTPIPRSLLSAEAFDAVIHSDFVFGCVDGEGVRLVLTELCAAYSRPYMDLASDILLEKPLQYGGRVCAAWDGNGCLVCYGELDTVEAQAELMNPQARRDRDAIYGVPREHLGAVGPSVVSINGAVASLGVTEFMLGVTGVRAPKRLVVYRGSMGRVTVDQKEPEPDCYYCKGIRGKGEEADIQRFLREGIEL